MTNQVGSLSEYLAYREESATQSLSEDPDGRMVIQIHQLANRAFWRALWTEQFYQAQLASFRVAKQVQSANHGRFMEEQ